MSAASRSVYYFGFYLLATGLALIVSPNTLLSLVGIAPTGEVWIRVLGSVVTAVGLYYVLMAPSNHTLFLTLTVYIRASIFVWFVVFAVLSIAPMQLILFGVVDLAGAGWTLMALRKG